MMSCISFKDHVKSKLVVRLLSLLNVECLYPVQIEALKKGVESGKSLLISAPTASGKTLVAMFAIASTLERKRGRAFYITPLKSIAFEKFKDFEVFTKLGFNVKVSVGDYEKGFPDADIVISTYEKLDSTIRNNPSILNRLAVLVVDEIHYVGDPERGPLLETLLARTLSSIDKVQIIALSATVPNANLLAKWLGAEAIVSEWRPVPLKEGVYDEGTSEIMFSDGSNRQIKKRFSLPTVNLIKDISDEGGHTLVFVQSRRKAVQLAKQTSKFSKELSFDSRLAKEYAREIMSTSTPRFIREEMASLVASGVSYHHAGLSSELRFIVEEAFRSGALAAIYATPTLAAGVNLPARRVVVAEYYRYESGYRRPISVAEYKQLAGRAGRPGLDKYGEAVIVASPTDNIEDIMNYYVYGQIEEVKSRLSGLRGLRHNILGLIASGISNIGEIIRIHRRTLYFFEGRRDIKRLARSALNDLIEWELVVEENDLLRTTPVGHETSRFYVDPEGVIIVKKLLSLANNITDSILLYIISRTPDVPTFKVGRRESEKLIDEALDVAPELFDLIEYGDDDEIAALKTTLILRSWIEEVPEDEIVRRYDIWPGDLHSLVETLRWLLSAYSSILRAASWCKRRDVPNHLKVMAERVKYGVKAELLPLLVIPGIGRVRARKLYDAGFKTLADLANVSPKDLESISGIGSATIASIMEFFGRNKEASIYKQRDSSSRRGLLAYMDV